MEYYTETIPVTLAEKLKEKGMPIRIWREVFEDKEGTDATFGACFDWLLEKEFVITIRADYYLNGEIAGWIPHFNHWGMKRCNTWHEAANAAIEKALTLI